MKKRKSLIMAVVLVVSLVGVTSTSALVLVAPPPIISPAIAFRPITLRLLEQADSLLEQAEEMDIEIPEEIYTVIENANTTGNAIYAMNQLKYAISELEALLG